MNRLITLLALGAVALTGCADPELEAKVSALSERVDTLEKKVESGAVASRGGGAAPAASAADEQAAQEKFQEVRAAISNLDYAKAKSLSKEISTKYPASRAAKALRKTDAEIAVVGKQAVDLKVEKWYGSKQTDMNQGKATLLVFWEVWCPHCKREVPELQAMYDKWNSQGLNMVGLTKITRSATEEKVTDFIAEHNVSYPMAKEDGDALSRHYGIRGIPAAAMVKDGKVIWRGHPGQLNDDLIGKMING
jgi:cytochrome c-type biogenesis protein